MTPETALEQKAAQQMGALMINNLKLAQLVETLEADNVRLKKALSLASAPAANDAEPPSDVHEGAAA